MHHRNYPIAGSNSSNINNNNNNHYSNSNSNIGSTNSTNRAGVYDGKIAGLYDLEETLGSGHFAVVKLARHVFTGEKVAVKVIDKTKLDDISRAHLFQEVRCMKLVQHPHVVRLYEVIDTQTKLYLILELGDGGDLYDYIMRHEGGLTENIAREYFRQIVRAISYCHKLHVVHRDLKPENVVFFEKLGVVKLTDFGFSNKFCPGQKLETSCGSLAYSAPEILLGDSYDAPAVDVWSLGVILYMLVCGQPPFQEANDSETLTMIMDCKYTMPSHISNTCKNLISTMLVRAPEKRATLSQIAQNSWLQMDDVNSVEAPEYLPLVSREQVSEEDHTLIIQKMINGNIATKEEILDALDRNEYNHITATYFLLAERKLRAHRQEQAQKRRTDLTLPVTNQSRKQGSKDQEATDSISSMKNHLLVPTNTTTHLTVPRTPGTEGGQTGRIRKCSIVQEEDDEDDVSCSGREDLTQQLNRRGSRSEGRINITVQDRIAETERLKLKDVNIINQSQIAKKEGFDGIAGVKLITSDNNNSTVERLGIAGSGCGLPFNRNLIAKNKTKLKAITKTITTTTTTTKISNERSSSVEKTIYNNKSIVTNDLVSTKFITESSTITIPIRNLNINKKSEEVDTNILIPKYKTMPSPTRPNSIASLNEIFEEGSSDSTATTPRPISRQNHSSNNNSQQPFMQDGCRAVNSNNHIQRRTKFHKSRTTSCSSSDASDDDSENRKKRANKIVDSITKPIPQRRDSHDDSSDSQDPGGTTTTSSTNNKTNTCVVNVIMSNSNGNQDSSDKNSSNSNSTTGRQKANQPVDFRRHRAGRRRPVETRLRESQSLNRITEVQESELIQNSATTPTKMPAAVNNSNNTISNTSENQNPSVDTNNSKNVANAKPKGFSARFLQTFKRQQQPPAEALPLASYTEGPNNQDEIEMVLGVELAKALKVTETKSSSSTKRIKILGRYFQVHKKLCIPLSGLFQRGRLYKTQSCGSIIRDKVNNTATNNSKQNSRHSALFSDKSRLIRNCIGGVRLLGSDSDINQNGSKDNRNNSSLIYSLTTSTGNANSNEAMTTPHDYDDDDDDEDEKNVKSTALHQKLNMSNQNLNDNSLFYTKC